MKFKRFKHLNAEPIPLGNFDDVSAEKLPEPIWIDVTREEHNRMFENVKHINPNCHILYEN